ncbi:MAG TPA: hypothetical protein VGD27_16330 [Longimicrobiales bacterium]
MVVRQYLQTEPVVAASYRLGCAGKALAAVVDPIRPVDRYLRDDKASSTIGFERRYNSVHADQIRARNVGRVAIHA